VTKLQLEQENKTLRIELMMKNAIIKEKIESVEVINGFYEADKKITKELSNQNNSYKSQIDLYERIIEHLLDN
jgi:hypothetical protein